MEWKNRTIFIGRFHTSHVEYVPKRKSNQTWILDNSAKDMLTIDTQFATFCLCISLVRRASANISRRTIMGNFVNICSTTFLFLSINRFSRQAVDRLEMKSSKLEDNTASAKTRTHAKDILDNEKSTRKFINILCPIITIHHPRKRKFTTYT